MNPLALESIFISGHVHCSSWLAIVFFGHTLPVWCCVREQINMAYQTYLVQRDGSFCNESGRLWMDIEWNQLEIGEFSSDCAKASGYRSTTTVGPRVRCRKLVEPGKAYCIVCWTERCYADRGAVVFTRHANSEAHQQKLQAKSSDAALPWVEWCQLICVISWTHLLHLVWLLLDSLWMY